MGMFVEITLSPGKICPIKLQYDPDTITPPNDNAIMLPEISNFLGT